MAERLCIAVCRQFEQEAIAALRTAGLGDVSIRAFPSACHGRSAADRDQALHIPDDIVESFDLAALVGGACRLEERPGMRTIRLETCFHILAPAGLIDSLLAEGAYLISPGWLAGWRARLMDWGFSPEAARGFFGESCRELVLLDTGIDPGSAADLAELSAHIGLPSRSIAIGVEHLALRLAAIHSDWLLEIRGREQAASLVRAEKKAADHALTLDLISDMADETSETNVIDKILDFATVLFAASAVRFTFFQNGEARGTLSACRDPAAGFQGKPHLKMEADHELDEDGLGFRIKVAHKAEVLGILEVAGVGFPAFIDAYLDMSRPIARMCGLALSNARIYRSLSETVAELSGALAKVKTLSGMLPICASCKRIRDDQGYWQQVEQYVGEHTQAEFSHGICPECAQKLYGAYLEK